MDEQQATSGTPPPSTPSPSLPTSPHWSESFVEHLRAVHFALSILAVAIIFTLLSGNEYDAQKAWTQASEIRDLSENWDRYMVHLFDSLSEANDGMQLPAEVGLGMEFIKDSNKTLYYSGFFAIHREDVMSGDEWQFFAGQFARPTSASSFRSWWEKLHRGVDLYFPNPQVVAFDKSNLEGERKCSGFVTYPNTVSLRVVCGSISAVGHAQDGPSITSREHLQLIHLACKDSLHPSMSANCTFELKGSAMTVPDIFESKPPRPEPVWATNLHYTENAKSVRIYETVTQKFYSDWKAGDFQTAFPDLAKADSGLENIPLKELPERLAQGLKQDQVIETFGLKIAVTDVTRWGLLILLAAQFYFWLHLHELTRRIEPSDPGWKVAWIGIYPQWLAFITVVVSACVLPLVAASLAGYRLRFEGHPHWQRSIEALAIGFSAYLALSTGFKLYKLRSGVSGTRRVYVPAEPTEPAI
jgi:hypothetical protein